MKLTLIILQSIDGYLARDHKDDLSWGSKADKEFFRTKTRELGTMIMGSGTFANMPDFAFKDRYSVVMTSNPNKFKDRVDKLNEQGNNIELFGSKPEECIAMIEQRNITEAALIGGGKLNGSFLQAGLINEMYITVAPVIFGYGIKTFDIEEISPVLTEYKLLEINKIDEAEVLLHYAL